MSSPLGPLCRAGLAVATATLALSAVPPSSAAPPRSGDGGGSPHFTDAQLDHRSARYTPRSDGTPGLVAQAAGTGDGGEAVQQQKLGSTKNDADVEHFESKGSIETARGAASTLALGGTNDWVALTSAGTLARYDAQGRAVWHTGVHDLFTDWHVTPTLSSHQEDLTPIMYEGFNPYQPGSTGRHPFAQADFSGDGVADVAVAYQLGVSPNAPFTTPGSALTSGTFVSLLDGRTGEMLWHVLVPGTVGSMLAQDGKLVIAESTGPDWTNNPVAEQGESRSALVAYRFDSHRGALTGTKAWTASTQAPWADWTDIESMGAGRITAGWTDTPLGLGNPRPADGHVLVVDTRTGRTLVDAKTPGYPRIVQQDATGDRVLVAELNDPLDAVRWDLTAIDARTGRRTVITSHESAIPIAIDVDRTAHGHQPPYVVAELAINDDLSDGASSVLGLDAAGHRTWSYTAASTVGAGQPPILGIATDPSADGQVLLTVGDGVAQSLDAPGGPDHTQLVALDQRTGAVSWHREGAVSADSITPYGGGYLTVGYDLTAWTTDRHGRTTALPMMADLYAADAVDVNGDGVNDLIAGGESQGVFAIDGKSLARGVTTVLWSRAVSASVHAVHVGQVTDSRGRTTQRAVAATSHGFVVLDPHTGAIAADVDTGAFQWNAPIVGGHVLASSDTAFGAYTADGHRAWAYRPDGTADARIVYSAPATDGDGRIFLEYGGVRSGFGTGASDPAPTAVALDATHGTPLWTRQPEASAKATWIESQAGVFASAAIPGAGGHGVAFAFGGDQPSTRGHTLMVLDGRTGAVVTSQQANGSATFQGYAASADQGLLWLHAFQMTSLPADGSAPYFIRTIPNVYQGVFATAQDGSEVLVGGIGGVYSWSTPLPNEPNSYPAKQGSAFAYFAGSVSALPMNPDKATDLVALPQDNTAYNLNQNVGSYSSDPAPTDAFPHGVTVLQSTGAAVAKGADAAAPAPSQAQVEASAVSAISDNRLPVGVANAPHEIRSQTAVSPSADTEVTRGYSPQQLQKRLGLTGDGTGQTVAISIAYHYPTAREDLNHYAEHFGLPQTCDTVAAGTDCFDFEVTYADGTQPEVDSGWNQEAALDIESVHAVAPHARIVLVEAKDASAAALYRAIDLAATLHPAAINNSWGMPEYSEESFYDDHCQLATTACVQSTGDDGYPAGYSSVNPHILAVGGTKLTLDAAGNTVSESGWSSTGGGVSYFEPRPSYQDGTVSSSHRAAPDVSFVADPTTGMAVYITVDGAHYWMQVGGTSLSSPLWAGILSATNQLRAAQGKPALVAAGADGDTLHRAIYSLGDALFDVTTGSNGGCGEECTAHAGYDTVTGLGSPLAGIDQALAAK